MAWNQQLASELKAAREETKAAQQEATAMKQERQAFFEQQMENEMAKASSARKDRERFLRKMDEEAKRSRTVDSDDMKTEAQLAKEKSCIH